MSSPSAGEKHPIDDDNNLDECAPDHKRTKKDDETNTAPTSPTASQSTAATSSQVNIIPKEEDDIASMLLKFRIPLSDTLVQRVKGMLHHEDDDENLYAINKLPDDLPWGQGEDADFLVHQDKRVGTLTIGFVHKVFFYDKNSDKKSCTLLVWPVNRKLGSLSKRLLEHYSTEGGQGPQSSQKKLNDSIIAFSRSLVTYENGQKTFLPFEDVYDGKEEIREASKETQLAASSIKPNDLVAVCGYVHKYTKDDVLFTNHVLKTVWLVEKAGKAQKVHSLKKGF